MNEQERREAVRHRYDRRCGYCTVRETEVGNELEIDHFQPRSAGGGDDLDNLVYCCTACNRLKGDSWSDADPLATPRRLLHPTRDDLTRHLREESDSRLTALTAVGAFHIERLRLNRSPLLALRRARQENARLRQNLDAALAEQTQLRRRIATLEQDVQDVMTQLQRLLGQ